MQSLKFQVVHIVKKNQNSGAETYAANLIFIW